MKRVRALVLMIATIVLMKSLVIASDQYHAFIGTYTGGKSKGIYVARFDSSTGKLGAAQLAAEITNPTFLAIHPSQRWLYAVGEVGGGGKGGNVSSFSIDAATGQLRHINTQSTRGAGPCHLSVADGRCLLVANYGSGSVAALPIGADGALAEATAFVQHQGKSVNERRQQGPHAHWIDTDPAGRFAFCCDLGLDQVLVYRLDAAKGTLTPNDPPFAATKPGAGPRHLAFHPASRFAYAINELDSTMSAFRYDAARGTLEHLQSVSTLPEDFTGNNTCAEVAVHPSGRFVYGSNRGHDSLAVFAIEGESGRMKWVQHQSTQGKTPRHFAIDPTGRWVLASNQDSDNIVVLALDPQSGRLTPTGQFVSCGKPVCAVFVPVK